MDATVAGSNVIVAAGALVFAGMPTNRSHVMIDVAAAAAVVVDGWCCRLSAGPPDYSYGRRIRSTERLCK